MRIERPSKASLVAKFLLGVVAFTAFAVVGIFLQTLAYNHIAVPFKLPALTWLHVVCMNVTLAGVGSAFFLALRKANK